MGTSGRAEGDRNLIRRLLQREDLGDVERFNGQLVEIFWPQDASWYLAYIIKVSFQCRSSHAWGPYTALRAPTQVPAKLEHALLPGQRHYSFPRGAFLQRYLLQAHTSF